jgi:hypothetical protein
VVPYLAHRIRLGGHVCAVGVFVDDPSGFPLEDGRGDPWLA